MYWIYILYSITIDRYYIGYTSNLENRLLKHNSNHKGFTGKANDWKIVYTEAFENKTNVIKREMEIKRWKSRARVEALIKNK